MSDSRFKSNSQSEKSPRNHRKQEWALMNDYRLLQQQNSRQKERLMNEQRKHRFQSDLNHIIQERKEIADHQKNIDLNYKQAIIQKVQKQKMEQQNRAFEKYAKRKQMQEDNRKLFGHLVKNKNNNKSSSKDEYSLDIGYTAEQIRNYQRQSLQKNMVDQLDRQIYIKERQKQQKKATQLVNDYKNYQQQIHQFSNRDRSVQNKHLKGQNPRVYNYYQEIAQSQNQRKKSFEKKQIEEAAIAKNEQQLRKEQEKKYKMTSMNNNLKNILEEQMKYKNYKKVEQSKVNPEDMSYSLLSGMFKPRKIAYDKRQYSQYLKRQVQDKKKKDQESRYMSQEQYRLNTNQLSKAVDGRYLNDTYIDRSIGALGDNKKINPKTVNAHIESQESELVKKKLEDLKHQNQQHHTARYGKIDHDYKHQRNGSVYF